MTGRCQLRCVTESSIFECGFAVVARFAQRLPILFFPKQRPISAMGRLMVNDSSGRYRPISPALSAQWIHSKKPFACAPPLRVIAPFGGGTAQLLLTLLVLFAVCPGCSFRTARPAAGSGRLTRHGSAPLSLGKRTACQGRPIET